VTIDATTDGGSRMTMRSRFPSTEALEQMAAMGMVEGITLAVGQMDVLLREQQPA
jgi:uncharacterized protein YndB with AHSA1/START domain